MGWGLLFSRSPNLLIPQAIAYVLNKRKEEEERRAPRAFKITLKEQDNTCMFY